MGRTAYEEALAKVEDGEDITNSFIPSYMRVADMHNTANNNEGFLESAVSTISNIPKFIGASIISGANQIYNIAPDVGNFFGGDFDRSETADVMAAIDSDFGAYYQENQESVDLVGFMASSLLPGIAGIKMLNAGQASLRATLEMNKFGATTSRALGLLVPDKGAAFKRAVTEVANNSAVASVTSRNALKAIGTGMGQGALEALAFETAVTATMFNSPILENQDFGDFVFNVAFGAAAFGVIGGAIDAAKVKSALAGAADTAAKEARPWVAIESVNTKSSTYEKLVFDIDQLHAMPPVPKVLDASRFDYLTKAAKDKTSVLDDRIRGHLNELSGGDYTVSENLFQRFKGADRETKLTSFLGATEATRMGVKSKVWAGKEKLIAKMKAGKQTEKEMEEFLDSTLEMSYIKMWGEGAGKVTTEKPVLTSLSDTLTSSKAKIKVTKSRVTAGKKNYYFNTSFNIGKHAGDKRKHRSLLLMDPLEANARYIWAGSSKLPKFAPTAKDPITIHVDDIPLAEKVFRDVAEEDLVHVKWVGLEEGETMGTSLQEFLGARKVDIVNRLLKVRGEGGLKPIGTGASKPPLIQEEIAAMVNVKNSLLSGEVLKDPTASYHLADILAYQHHAEEYTKQLVELGVRKKKHGVVDILRLPHNIKMVYDTKPFKGLDNHVVEGMVVIKEQQKLFQEGIDRAVAYPLGDDFNRLQAIDAGEAAATAVPSGAGSGFLGAASRNYGSLGAKVEDIGRVTASAINKAKEKAREALEPLVYKLGNNEEAYLEWSALNQKVRSIEGEYGLNELGDALEPVVLLRWKALAEEAAAQGKIPPKQPVLANPTMPPRIELKTQEVRSLARAHIEVNGMRAINSAGIRAAQGVDFNRSPDVFYAPPVSPKDFPHFAIVIDESITSGNQSKMLYATSGEELAAQMKKLESHPHLTLLTKGEAERHYKAIGQFSEDKAISSNYLDIEAHRKGVSAPFFVPTDPKKITSDLLSWHMQREAGSVREAILAKYEVPFEELRSLGRDFTDIELSRFDSMNTLEFAEDAVKNPFGDYIRTALALKKTEQYPFWSAANRVSDIAVSRVGRKVRSLFQASKSPEELTRINALLEKSGYKGAAYDNSMNIFANATEARGTLAATVQKANALMATVVLRWDTLNAVNNAVSANVLLGAETKAVIGAIGRGDTEAAGALAKLTRIGVPGTSETIMSPTKMIANAVKKYGTDSEAMKFYKDNGYLTGISDQYRQSLDNISFTGRESVKNWDNRLDTVHARLKKAGDLGEVITGNRLAEEFNRFVAADVMKQMTDVAVTRNLMTAKEQLAYINTFVNRTQGNYLASQRPGLFQGPIGQAIGLFQTYQFNLMQQLLRHVGEGHAKDAMTLLGLQGTIHGMNGLPGFNALNTHLIGTASGNTQHRDTYDAVYGIAGKEAGNWLMYGMASNTLGLIHPDLKVNLYTRGDINPRHVTIVPTDPSQVAIVQATGKVLKNLFETTKKLGAGGDISTTLLQGLEHNGLSRPLAGLAQTMQGLNNPLRASYSTSKRGNVIASNDLLSLANLGRVVGGKPLDEAIALDATYRYKSYALADAKKRQVLGQAIKTTMIAGQDPTQEQVDGFAEEYAALGGRQEEFNKWFTQLYKTANLSQANKLQQRLKSPFSQSMQKIMGGRELRDFSE